MTDNNETTPTWRDPDEAPELSDEWFAAAHVCEGGVLVKRGRGRVPSGEHKELKDKETKGDGEQSADD